MATFGLVKLKEVWKMLDHCASGYTVKTTPHYYCIRFNGLTYPTFPLGPHGKRTNPAIQSGEIKSLVNNLKLDKECVLGKIPALRGRL